MTKALDLRRIQNREKVQLLNQTLKYLHGEKNDDLIAAILCALEKDTPGSGVSAAINNAIRSFCPHTVASIIRFARKNGILLDLQPDTLCETLKRHEEDEPEVFIKIWDQLEALAHTQNTPKLLDASRTTIYATYMHAFKTNYNFRMRGATRSACIAHILSLPTKVNIDPVFALGEHFCISYHALKTAPHYEAIHAASIPILQSPQEHEQLVAHALTQKSPRALLYLLSHAPEAAHHLFFAESTPAHPTWSKSCLLFLRTQTGHAKMAILRNIHNQAPSLKNNRSNTEDYTFKLLGLPGHREMREIRKAHSQRLRGRTRGPRNGFGPHYPVSP